MKDDKSNTSSSKDRRESGTCLCSQAHSMLTQYCSLSLSLSLCYTTFNKLRVANPPESLQQILKQPNVFIRQPYFQVPPPATSFQLFIDQTVNLLNYYHRILTPGFRKKTRRVRKEQMEWGVNSFLHDLNIFHFRLSSKDVTENLQTFSPIK